MAKILVVEDDKILREGYSDLFTKAGHQVETAVDGKDALAKTKDKDPDLILLDLMMPGMNGLEFLEVYQPAKHPGVKVVVFTNVEASDSIFKAMQMGARGYLTKIELSSGEMVKTIETILAKEK